MAHTETYQRLTRWHLLVSSQHSEKRVFANAYSISMFFFTDLVVSPVKIGVKFEVVGIRSSFDILRKVASYRFRVDRAAVLVLVQEIVSMALLFSCAAECM